MGGECECGDKEVLALPLSRNFTDGAKSSPRLSKSIPSLITIVPSACSACSKLISMREVRLALESGRVPPRSLRDAIG